MPTDEALSMIGVPADEWAQYRQELKEIRERKSVYRIQKSTIFRMVLYFFWSGRWESNPPLKLGKLSFYR